MSQAVTTPHSNQENAIQTPEGGRREPSDNAVVLLLRSLGEDFLTISHGLLVNKIAGSMLLPRAVRFLIYRAFGMKFRTPNIFYGARFTANRVSLGRGTFVNTDVQFEDVAPIVIGDD